MSVFKAVPQDFYYHLQQKHALERKKDRTKHIPIRSLTTIESNDMTVLGSYFIAPFVYRNNYALSIPVFSKHEYEKVFKVILILERCVKKNRRDSPVCKEG